MPLGVTLALRILAGILMAIRCVCLAFNMAFTIHLLYNLYVLQSIRTVEQEHPYTLRTSTLLNDANHHIRMVESVARRDT